MTPSRLDSKGVPGNPNDVAQIEKLKKLERLLAQHVEPRVNLQPPAIARQMCERSLPHRPQRHGPSWNGNTKASSTLPNRSEPRSCRS